MANETREANIDGSADSPADGLADNVDTKSPSNTTCKTLTKLHYSVGAAFSESDLLERAREFRRTCRIGADLNGNLSEVELSNRAQSMLQLKQASEHFYKLLSPISVSHVKVLQEFKLEQTLSKYYWHTIFIANNNTDQGKFELDSLCSKLFEAKTVLSDPEFAQTTPSVNEKADLEEKSSSEILTPEDVAPERSSEEVVEESMQQASDVSLNESREEPTAELLKEVNDGSGVGPDDSLNNLSGDLSDDSSDDSSEDEPTEQLLEEVNDLTLVASVEDSLENVNEESLDMTAAVPLEEVLEVSVEELEEAPSEETLETSMDETSVESLEQSLEELLDETSAVVLEDSLESALEETTAMSFEESLDGTLNEQSEVLPEASLEECLGNKPVESSEESYEQTTNKTSQVSLEELLEESLEETAGLSLEEELEELEESLEKKTEVSLEKELKESMAKTAEDSLEEELEVSIDELLGQTHEEMPTGTPENTSELFLQDVLKKCSSTATGSLSVVATEDLSEEVLDDSAELVTDESSIVSNGDSSDLAREGSLNVSSSCTEDAAHNGSLGIESKVSVGVTPDVAVDDGAVDTVSDNAVDIVHDGSATAVSYSRSNVAPDSSAVAALDSRTDVEPDAAVNVATGSAVDVAPDGSSDTVLKSSATKLWSDSRISNTTTSSDYKKVIISQLLEDPDDTTEPAQAGAIIVGLITGFSAVLLSVLAAVAFVPEFLQILQATIPVGSTPYRLIMLLLLFTLTTSFFLLISNFIEANVDAAMHSNNVDTNRGFFSRLFDSGASPRRILAGALGPVLLGLGQGISISTGYGAFGFSVLLDGIGKTFIVPFWLSHTVVTIGCYMLAWFWGRVPLGLGTVTALLLIGPAISFGSGIIPDGLSLAINLAVFAFGLLLVAFGIALAASAALGPDGFSSLSLAAERVNLWAFAAATLLWDITAIAAGVILGGSVGIATAVGLLVVPLLLHFFIPPLRRVLQ